MSGNFSLWSRLIGGPLIVCLIIQTVCSDDECVSVRVVLSREIVRRIRTGSQITHTVSEYRAHPHLSVSDRHNAVSLRRHRHRLSCTPLQRRLLLSPGWDLTGFQKCSLGSLVSDVWGLPAFSPFSSLSPQTGLINVIKPRLPSQPGVHCKTAETAGRRLVFTGTPLWNTWASLAAMLAPVCSQKQGNRRDPSAVGALICWPVSCFCNRHLIKGGGGLILHNPQRL